MEKQIEFQNVIFKFESKENDKSKTGTYHFEKCNNTTKATVIKLIEHEENKPSTYHFKICDKITKATAIEFLEKTKEYIKDETYDDPEYDFNNIIYGGFKGKYHFKVKDKWLAVSEFSKDAYYQGDLELLFYSMDRPDLSKESRFRFIPLRHKREGYYAKLHNIKQIDIED